MLAEDTVGAVEARRWFGIAAEQGHAEARATLGTMHYGLSSRITSRDPDHNPSSPCISPCPTRPPPWCARAPARPPASGLLTGVYVPSLDCLGSDRKKDVTLS